MQVNLRSLFGKLNPATRSVMEAAAGLCVAKTNYDVEVEHVLLKLLDTVDTDAAAIIRHAEIDTARATAALNRAIDRFKVGNGRTPAFSPDVLDMMTDAWTIASIDFQTSQVRTGFLLVALLGNDKLSRVLQDVTLEFRKISLEDLRKNFDRITQASREAVSAEPATASNSAAGAGV